MQDKAKFNKMRKRGSFMSMERMEDPDDDDEDSEIDEEVTEESKKSAAEKFDELTSRASSRERVL